MRQILYFLVGSLIFSASFAREMTYSYYSLVGGDVDIFINEKGGASFFYEKTAELSEAKTCNHSNDFICVINSEIFISIPKDISKLLKKAIVCSEPEWTLNKHKFKVISNENHGLYKCDEPINSYKRQSLGNSYEAFKVEVVNLDNNQTRYFLWSLKRGLIGFSNYSGEFWLKSKCGYGASESCQN